MMNSSAIKLLSTLALSAVISACSQGPEQGPELSFQDSFRQALETAKPGDVITVPEGTFAFDRSLILNTDGVTIRGQGMEKSILSFKGQIAGAEGLSVSASDFTIEDLAIEDTVGDALKVNEGNNIVIRRIRTEWTNGPDVNNGAYGIYPVQTTNVLIEGNVAIAASDAGVYVGQSKQVIVRNNRAEFNVAGIEVENTIGADVYQNIANNNTGGILVFNMPNLSQEGARTRIFRNLVHNNNTENFAAPGGAVAGVPAGSGIVINANDEVEIFENDLAGNDTAHIIISSVFSTNYASRETASAFDPYPETLYIHDNRYEGGGASPDTLELKALKLAMFGLTGAFPNVIWDGFLNPEKAVDGKLPPTLNFCIAGEPGTQLLNVDGPGGYANPAIEQSQFQCRHEPLPPVQLSI